MTDLEYEKKLKDLELFLEGNLLIEDDTIDNEREVNFNE